MAGSNAKQTKKSKQKAFLEVYARNMGNITDACKTISIMRRTYYYWMKKDENFKKQFEETDPYELTEEALKAKLFEHIDANNLTALIFTLKAKFGWTEGQPMIHGKTLNIKIDSAD